MEKLIEWLSAIWSWPNYVQVSTWMDDCCSSWITYQPKAVRWNFAQYDHACHWSREYDDFISWIAIIDGFLCMKFGAWKVFNKYRNAWSPLYSLYLLKMSSCSSSQINSVSSLSSLENKTLNYLSKVAKFNFIEAKTDLISFPPFILYNFLSFIPTLPTPTARPLLFNNSLLHFVN